MFPDSHFDKMAAGDRVLTIEERRSRLRRRRGRPRRIAVSLLGWMASGLLFVLLALVITTGR